VPEIFSNGRVGINVPVDVPFRYGSFFVAVGRTPSSGRETPTTVTSVRSGRRYFDVHDRYERESSGGRRSNRVPAPGESNRSDCNRAVF